MWQTYFTPPVDDTQSVNIATTRRVGRYTITREGEETIAWQQAEIVAERWHRRSDDGATDAYVWLAPSLRYVPVKMRVDGQLPRNVRGHARGPPRFDPRRRSVRAAMTPRANQLAGLAAAIAAVRPLTSPADALLHRVLPAHPPMGQQDRAFVADGVFA